MGADLAVGQCSAFGFCYARDAVGSANHRSFHGCGWQSRICLGPLAFLFLQIYVALTLFLSCCVQNALDLSAGLVVPRKFRREALSAVAASFLKRQDTMPRRPTIKIKSPVGLPTQAFFYFQKNSRYVFTASGEDQFTIRLPESTLNSRKPKIK